MQQKLIVVSMDALIYEDLEYLSTKPSFRWLMEHGAKVNRIRSVFPTLTYPCHATMSTGQYPSGHGVVNNTYFEPGVVNSPWCWFHDVYKAKDLPDACKEKGLTVASVGWPANGKHAHVDYLVGEIAATRAKTVEAFYHDYALTGTPQWLWDAVCLPNIHWRTEKRRVAMFNAAVCCDIVRYYKPDLVLLHLANPDNARHKYGVFSPDIQPALDECEEILSWLLGAVQDSGVDYNLVITADHGQMDTFQTANPNTLFAQNGYLELDENGLVTNWRAWSHSVGMSAVVYVKDPADEPAVYLLLKQYEGQGFRRIYSREEAAKDGFSGDFAFVLDSDGRTGFDNYWLGEYLVPLEYVHGSHGFHPENGPSPTLLAIGPAFTNDAVLERANLVDGATTWAHILGVSLPDAQGRVLQELLKE